MMKRKAFTLIELLVVIAIIALLVSILLPSLNHARELARRAMCMTQLNGLGKAIMLYNETNNNKTPNCATTSGDAYNGAYGADFVQVNATTGAYTGAITCNANSYALLAREGMVSYAAFICPSQTANSDTAKPDSDEFGFKGANQVTYGFQPAHGTATSTALLGASNMSSSTVIAGDAPNASTLSGGSDLRPTENHGETKGQQNMLTYGGSVKKAGFSNGDNAKAKGADYGYDTNDNIFQSQYTGTTPTLGNNDSFLVYDITRESGS